MLSHSGVDEEPVKDDRISGRGLLTVPDAAWKLAVERAAVIGPLAESSTGGSAVDEAAAKLGISRERVYFLIRPIWRRQRTSSSYRAKSPSAQSSSK